MTASGARLQVASRPASTGACRRRPLGRDACGWRREGWLFGPLPGPYAKEWEASGRSFALLAGLAWKLLLDAFDEAQREIGDERWLEVRYEDVLTDPRRHTAAVLEFLGLSWTDAFESGFQAFRFEGDRARAWRAVLGDPAAAELDTSLADHLTRR